MKRLRELADGCVAVDIEADPSPCYYQLRFTNVSAFPVELTLPPAGLQRGGIRAWPVLPSGWIQARVFGWQEVEDVLAGISVRVPPTHERALRCEQLVKEIAGLTPPPSDRDAVARTTPVAPPPRR